MKMAPGPEQQQQRPEPVAPDKSISINHHEVFILPVVTAEEDVKAIVDSNASLANDANALPVLCNNAALVDAKQEEPSTLSTLNEGELRALLDEAFTYKCPKDREGKSSLFKELLQEAEADETEEGRWAVKNNSSSSSSINFALGGRGVRNARRQQNQRRSGTDSYYSSTSSTSSTSCAERLTHGGSLQNLARELEVEGLGAYLASTGSSSARRRQKRQSGPSVSARQREGGSLPSNVDASHTLASLANFDELFNKKKGLSEEKSVYDWTNKEKSKSLDKPSYSKKEEKEKERKDSNLSGSCDIESESREKRSNNRGKLGTNEMLGSDNPPPECNKQDSKVIGLDDCETNTISERNASTALGGVQRPRSLDAEDEEGTEMKVIDNRRPVPQFITRASFEIPNSHTSVDSHIEFPTFREHTTKLEKSKININGTEGTSSIPFPAYSNVKCVMSTPSSVYSVMSWPSPNISMVSRLAAQHIAGKDTSLSGDKKSLDENGNAVQGERKKNRRKNIDQKVIVYQAENVKGHRDDDIDSLISFIENKEFKSKKGKTGNNSVKVKSASNTKSRSRDNKDIKRDNSITNKLQKSNSLEEISKTKLEDLTTDKSTTSSGSNSISSQHGSVALRRAKQRSTGDASASDSRGDRRSWGTEEGQSIYCNDIGEDYSSRRNSVKKNNNTLEVEAETEFEVVTNKKKKTKKQQRRSSSGGRPQNLAGSGSYLPRGRGFTNEYRTPLSPEIRRKSASSMPPSDKSDSSDLDSVHSLPVTSNSCKQNSGKVSTSGSSSSAPQASYAEIARMATLNISANHVLNISNLMPSMMNQSTWSSVASSKASSTDMEKVPNDYYPSLDELQHVERKTRQQPNSGGNLDNKPPSPKPSVPKGSQPKESAHDEAISKVAKYVQDIEKMHEQSNKQQQASSSNSSPVCSESMPSATSLSSELPSSPPELEHSAESSSSKDSYASSKHNVRVRKSNLGSSNREYSAARSPADESRLDSKKPLPHLQPAEETAKYSPAVTGHLEEKETKKSAGTTAAGASETGEHPKTRIVNSSKPLQQFRPPVDSEAVRLNKTDRLPKASKEQPPFTSKDSSKVCYPQQMPNCRGDKPLDDADGKKGKPANPANKGEKEHKCSDSHVQPTTTNLSTASSISSSSVSSSRPAVILLDESCSDQERNRESECSELTFGFEINEQLLQSEGEEEDEETPIASPELSRFSNSPPSHSRQQHQAPLPQQPPIPPMFEKQPQQHIRYDKFPPNYTINPTYIPMHPIATHPLLVPTVPFALGPPMRLQGSYMLPQPPPPIIEKCRSQPKEDFSTRYIAPDESHVQKFNHDKIVTFVGTAWDDVMQESGSTSSGRVQYYSGQ